MFILKVVKALNAYKVHYAVVGGYAVALHGAVRGTVDLDLIINLTKNSMINAEKALNTIGLKSKIPVSGEDVFNFRGEYIKNKNMIAWNLTNPNNPAESVDIIIPEDLKQYKSKKIKIDNQNIKVISIEGLIKIKEKSSRPQDIEDVKALRRINK